MRRYASCQNCGSDGETFDRLAVIENTHIEETDVRAVELCRTCRDAFDLGAGNG